MKKQISLLILFILSGFILSREALADTISTMLSDTDQCQAIPTCESLGYIKTPSDCGSIPYISCPMDKNKVFCPFDCAPYPLDGCNDSIGECEQCSLEGKWRYTSCIDGYSLYEGKCTPQDCEEDGALFKSGPPNTTIADESQIEYCWKDGRYFRYRGCKHGWGYDSENFQCEMITDCNKDSKKNGKNYVDLAGKVCPHNANCDDVCYEFNESTGEATAKTNIVCDSSQGLRLQPAGDISGEGYKCRKHPIGNIAFYCKNVSEIPEGLDLDGDQIISLEATDYDLRPMGCEAIGVVFDNDGGKTKIVGLKDIQAKGSAPYTDYLEDLSSETTSSLWSSCDNSKFGSRCKVTYFEENKVNTNQNAIDFYPDGESNTNVIIAWARENGFVAHAAEATKLYYPRYGSGNIICPDNSKCGKGKWYLPSLAELRSFYLRYNASTRRVDRAFGMLESEGIALSIKRNTYNNYWSSVDSSATNAWHLDFYGGGTNSVPKGGHRFNIRPVLAIDD